MSIYEKLRKTLSLLKHRNNSEYVNGKSYYSDQTLKRKKEIIHDQLRLLWKYGEFERFYFTYGFDRKEMTFNRMMDEYFTPYSLFQSQIRKLNYCPTLNPKFHGTINGVVNVADKYYFYIILDKIGVPTPSILLYIRDKEVLFVNKKLYISTSKQCDIVLSDFLSNDIDAFAKPVDGECGMGIFTLMVKNGVILVNGTPTNKDIVIKMLTSANYIVQNRIHQHEKLDVLCDSSINTIRLQTVISKNGTIVPFGAMLRIGRKGSTVDNWAAGGVLVGINMDHGTLKEKGIMKPAYGSSVNAHPDTQVPFKDYEIPYFHEAVEMAIQIHKHFYYLHSIGWDIAITKEGPVFIEANSLWEISMAQATYGGLKKQLSCYFEM